VLVLVIDSLDLHQKHPSLPSFTFFNSDPLLTSNGQSSIARTITSTSTIRGAKPNKQGSRRFFRGEEIFQIGWKGSFE
jgi:hypothetical protein